MGKDQQDLNAMSAEACTFDHSYPVENLGDHVGIVCVGIQLGTHSPDFGKPFSSLLFTACLLFLLDLVLISAAITGIIRVVGLLTHL
jgi:hypothetical protein